MAKDYEEFARREQEMERRSQMLHMRETQQLRRPPNWNQAQPSPPEHNWPPLPPCCPVQPCFYQDINVEIQTEYQTHVRFLYYLWIFHGILFVPLSYLFWFRPAYKAFKNNSSVYMKTFF